MTTYSLEAVNEYIEACKLESDLGSYLMNLDPVNQQSFLFCLSAQVLDSFYNEFMIIKGATIGNPSQGFYVGKHQEEYKKCKDIELKLDPNLKNLDLSSNDCYEIIQDYQRSNQKCSNKIDISNLDKAEVLVALYNNAAFGQGFAGTREMNAPNKLSIEEARDILSKTQDFDYLGGRELKVNLESDNIYTDLYDRVAGECAAYYAIKPLFGEEGLSAEAEEF
jgi:hypothetical protein